MISSKMMSQYFLLAVFVLLVGATPAHAEYIDDEQRPELPLYMDVPTAYMLSKGQLEASVFYRFINDTVDVFDFKGDFGAANDIGSRGDYHGLQGIFHFGIWDRTQVSYIGEMRELEAGLPSGDVEYLSHDIQLKTTLLDEASWYPTMTFGILYRGNRAENISRSFESFSGNIGGIPVPQTPLSDPTVITFGGIEDDTYGVSLLASKSFTPQWSIHGIFEYSRTEVDSELDLDLSQNLSLDVLNEFGDIANSSRYKSNNFTVGIGTVYQIAPRMMVGVNYKRIQLDRFDRVIVPERDFNINHVVEWRASYLPTSWLAVTVTGTYLSNQFLGVIPSLYNARTARRFDQDYGYIGVGLTIFHDFASRFFSGDRF